MKRRELKEVERSSMAVDERKKGEKKICKKPDGSIDLCKQRRETLMVLKNNFLFGI